MTEEPDGHLRSCRARRSEGEVMTTFREMDDAALLAEFKQWDYKVKSAIGWGAGLMQAAKWRDACGRILAERGLMQDFEPCIRRDSECIKKGC